MAMIVCLFSEVLAPRIYLNNPLKKFLATLLKHRTHFTNFNYLLKQGSSKKLDDKCKTKVKKLQCDILK